MDVGGLMSVIDLFAKIICHAVSTYVCQHLRIIYYTICVNLEIQVNREIKTYMIERFYVIL